jgi:hypothetical protein
MGINDWRAKRQIKYPERGVLRVIGRHDEHSRPSTTGTRIAGIITAPGMPAARIEHKMEDPARWEGVTAVPVTVDRNDPSKFVVMWEELESGAWQDPGDVNPVGAGAPGGFGPNVVRTSASIRIGPDNMPINVPIPPEAAARVQSAMGKLFGQGRGGVLGQALSEAVGEALSEATGLSYNRQPPINQPYNQSYGQPPGQPYNQQPPADRPSNQPDNQQPPAAQPGGFAQVDPQAFHQPFGEVDPEAFRSPQDRPRPED